MVDFLEGLADHRFHKDVPITAPRQELSGSLSCPYNSDEEEAVPELEKEEAELSMMMSQRWDTDIPGPSARYGILVDFSFQIVSKFSYRVLSIVSLKTSHSSHQETGILLSSLSLLPSYCRRLVKEANESSSEDERELSEEEMDWSGNNLFADLSIPQLDGAADENSGVYQHVLLKQTQRTLHAVS